MGGGFLFRLWLSGLRPVGEGICLRTQNPKSYMVGSLISWSLFMGAPSFLENKFLNPQTPEHPKPLSSSTTLGLGFRFP